MPCDSGPHNPIGHFWPLSRVLAAIMQPQRLQIPILLCSQGSQKERRCSIVLSLASRDIVHPVSFIHDFVLNAFQDREKFLFNLFNRFDDVRNFAALFKGIYPVYFT
jgi:hypothetical protein